MLGPRVQGRVISHASTNLHNLSHGHIGTLFVSAFVIDAGPIYVWLPGLMCLLALAELLWRSGRLLVAFAVGHIGATLLVAVGLTAAVELGWLSADVTRATDVGMSYGASAVLGSLSAAIPRRWRPAWIGWWLAVGVAVVARRPGLHRRGPCGGAGARHPGVDAVRAARRVDARAVSAARRRFGFGFLMLANTSLSLIVATGLGAVGALVAEVVVGRQDPLAGGRRTRRHRMRTDARASRDAALICESPMIAGWLISP